jgi:hypothetical protein
MSEKYLTIRREPDGALMPYLDGERLVGCVEAVVNGSQRLVQVTFHSAYVFFDTAKNLDADKLN